MSKRKHSSAFWFTVLICAVIVVATICMAQKAHSQAFCPGNYRFPVERCWQTVKPALPPQHHLAPHAAPPVLPATACRVYVVGQDDPVTAWIPCWKADRQARGLSRMGVYSWVERKKRKIGVKP